MQTDVLASPPINVYFASIQSYIQQMFANPTIRWNQDPTDRQSFTSTNFAKVCIHVCFRCFMFLFPVRLRGVSGLYIITKNSGL
jgi:hypothetical protein